MGRFLRNVESLCPVCLKKIIGHKVEYDDGVYLEKVCNEHGLFKTLIWEGEGYESWSENEKFKTPSITSSNIDKGCPYDCGICSEHRQETCCVLLELTSRCNLKCPICFASSNENIKEDISLARIGEYYDYLMECGGPYNIQLSGGEPTLREDLEEIIKLGRKKGFTFFQLNTNGIKIGEDENYIKSLSDAGLNTVFLQFDGVSEEAYLKLRNKNLLDIKIKAIENCKRAGVGVVLVPTVVKDVNLQEIGKIIDFAIENMPTVRGVHFQPISYFGRYEGRDDTYRITIPKMLREVENQMSGKMKLKDFLPGGAENSYCSFHANFLVNEDKSLKALGSKNSCCSKPTSSKQSREFVAQQWSGRKEINLNPSNNSSCCCKEKNEVSNTKSLDDFLDRFEKYTMAISGMLFQDVWNLDLDRLKQCYIHVVGEDMKLIPFCAYNLTSINNESLYRKTYAIR